MDIYRYSVLSCLVVVIVIWNCFVTATVIVDYVFLFSYFPILVIVAVNFNNTVMQFVNSS